MLDLKFHPYKMMMAHKLTIDYYDNCKNLWEKMLHNIPLGFGIPTTDVCSTCLSLRERI